MHKPIPSMGAFKAIKNSFQEFNFLKGSKSIERLRIQDNMRARKYGEVSENTENLMDSNKVREGGRDIIFL